MGEDMRLRQTVVAWGLLLAGALSVSPARAAKLADGTAVRVRLTSDVLSSKVTVGTRVDFEVAHPVMLQGAVAIPVGAVVWGGVQEVKSGKLLRIDVEGLRLPDQQIVRLRCSPQRTSKVTKDEMRIESQVGKDLGAARGAEFVAYLDQDVNVNVAAAPAAPAQPAPVVAPVAKAPEAPAPAAPVATPTPAPPAPAAPVVAAPEVRAPAPAAPVAPVAAVPAAPVETPAPDVHPAAAAQPADYITVECFSEPMGADIMIDDEYHGSTPSILKLRPGNHQIEYRLMGYKPHSQPLNLTPGSGLRTVRMTLEKLP